jgi:hypothetical protein
VKAFRGPGEVALLGHRAEHVELADVHGHSPSEAAAARSGPARRCAPRMTQIVALPPGDDKESTLRGPWGLGIDGPIESTFVSGPSLW